ncbi:MAG: sugar phosphate isomerase/epimerase [Fibrobacter sp.]|jgi:sugar phosphate isomerase/epimerase|nr:sugar phosphate isomerase/epimerase [Fibrobacter sp.]
MTGRKKKKKYPFLLGTTSYIIPDGIIPNVKVISPIVDDIELILFESSSFSNIPSANDISELRTIAEYNGCGYTVHLPIDRKAGDPDERVRREFRDEACRIIDLTHKLSPRAWILHLEGIEKGSGKEELSRWQKWCRETVSDLVKRAENQRLIAIENLSYPVEWNESFATVFNTSYCFDIGHLWLQSGLDWESLCVKLIPDTAVVHFHGVHEGKDHISLSDGDREQQRRFLMLLKDAGYRGVLTLEIFNEKDLHLSMEVLGRLWELLP